MRKRILLCAAAAVVVTTIFAGAPCCAAAQTQEDDLCQRLFRECIIANRKESQTVAMSACEIIAVRGRTSGFWRTVLAELSKRDNYTERYCVTILGLMLEEDAGNRDAIKSKTMTAQTPFVVLPNTLVPELIARAEKGGNTLLDRYLTALARARDERCKDLFLKVLQDRNGYHGEGLKFHAAVGLANLGDATGVEWMIAHCADKGLNVWGATPARNMDLDTNCMLALRSVANRNDLTTKAAFEEWWTKNPKPFALNWPVSLRDR